jgi:transcriptional regulator with XRE-family HTH domain
MSIAARLITLRKERNLTQQGMADKVGLHVNQIRRYETGNAQPSLEALKKIVLALNITIDSLVFDNGERGPDEDLRLQFEALSQFSPEEKKIAKAVIESLILKHEARRFSAAGRAPRSGIPSTGTRTRPSPTAVNTA